MIGLDEARAAILASCEPLEAEAVSVARAAGRVLTHGVDAQHPYPNADLSAMDGYAVRSEDISEPEVAVEAVGESRAGAPWTGSLGRGQAVRIFTGAIVPDSADAVVIQEDTRASGDRIEILETPRLGANIRRLGEGHRPGDRLLEAGAVVGPAAVGLLISDGHAQVQVHARPRVAILGTGDELLAPGERPERAGSVVDGNGPMIEAFVEGRGGVVAGCARAIDSPDDIAAWLSEQAAQSDLLLTTGGASVGDHDCIAGAWSVAGIETRFWKIAVKPGKPLRFGVLERGGRGIPVLALPGNPLAVLSALEQLVGPVLDRLSGRPGRTRPRLLLPLTEPLSKRAGRAHLVRGVATADGFQPARSQGSHLLRAAAQSDAVGHLGRELERLEAGAPIEVEVTSDDLRGARLRPEGSPPIAVGVTGDSNAGKTQLVEALVRGLRDRGARVGTVKHATHAVDVDTPGKDSWRHAEAGAEVVVLVGPEKSAVFRAGSLEARHDWMAPFGGAVDWVIIEGFRAAPLPQIEVLQSEQESLERRPNGWRLTRSGTFSEGVIAELLDALVTELD